MSQAAVIAIYMPFGKVIEIISFKHDKCQIEPLFYEYYVFNVFDNFKLKLTVFNLGVLHVVLRHEIW